MPTNWRKFGRNGWKHPAREGMRVFFRRNANPKRPEAYQVFHAHPGKDGGVIPQPWEYAVDKRTALRKCRIHMRHWNDPRKWRDYW